jgi:hypothetical protein
MGKSFQCMIHNVVKNIYIRVYTVVMWEYHADLVPARKIHILLRISSADTYTSCATGTQQQYNIFSEVKKQLYVYLYKYTFDTFNSCLMRMVMRINKCENKTIQKEV